MGDDVETLTWGGLYKDSWKGLIVPEAFAHPAKVARGLAVRLFDHGFERGWWRKNDLVADPFMGICGFGVIAAYKGLRFVGVEIEERFHSLCLENVALHRRRWEAGGDAPPICLLGDSREFAKLVGGVTKLLALWDVYEAGGGAERLGDFGAWVRSVLADVDAGAALVAGAAACVTSPPYANQVVRPRDVNNLAGVPVTAEQHWGRTGPAQGHYLDAYGATPGQLGALPSGDADAVLTSPPYAGVQETRAPEAAAARRERDRRHCLGRGSRGGDPDGPGNLPQGTYGATPGQVGALKAGDAGAVMTSPGYGGSEISDNRKTVNRIIAGLGRKDGKRRGNSIAATIGAYADEANVSARSGETYWDAVRCIYGQAYLALRPGGVACVVVKSFIRKGAVVDLPGQTWRLLLSLGFLPVERIRCLLSEETREPSLFGGEEIRKRSRVSFFRRLAEKKGAPGIPWEEILVVRRPAAGEG